MHWYDVMIYIVKVQLQLIVKLGMPVYNPPAVPCIVSPLLGSIHRRGQRRQQP